MTDDTIAEIVLLKKRFLRDALPTLTNDEVELILAALTEYQNYIKRITPEY